MLYGDVYMPWWGIAALLGGTIILFTFLHFISKNKHPFKRALLSMCAGLLTLLFVNLLSAFTKVYIPVSLLSLLTAAVGGVPGVTLLLFLNLIL